MGSYNKALSLKPDFAKAYKNMGISFKAQGKLEEAIVLTIKLSHLNLIMLKRTIARLLLSMIKESWKKQFRHTKSILFKSDFARGHKNLSFALSSGSYQEGLDEYEWDGKLMNF